MGDILIDAKQTQILAKTYVYHTCIFKGFYYSPYAFLTTRRTLLIQIDYHLDRTDVIFLPLTRAWVGEGYDELSARV